MAHGGRKEAAGPIRDVPVGGSREYLMRAPIVGQFGMLAATDRRLCSCTTAESGRHEFSRA
jgi:hypothetical protein